MCRTLLTVSKLSTLLREDSVQFFGVLEGIRSNIDECVTWMNTHCPFGGSVGVSIEKVTIAYEISIGNTTAILCC